MTDPTLLSLIRQVRAQRQATDALEGERLRLEGSLIEFVEEAWPYIDAAPYQPNWAIDALCEHLQAVTEGMDLQAAHHFPPRCRKNHPHVGLLDCLDMGATRADLQKWPEGTFSDGQLHSHYRPWRSATPT